MDGERIDVGDRIRLATVVPQNGLQEAYRRQAIEDGMVGVDHQPVPVGSMDELHQERRRRR